MSTDDLIALLGADSGPAPDRARFWPLALAFGLLGALALLFATIGWGQENPPGPPMGPPAGGIGAIAYSLWCPFDDMLLFTLSFYVLSITICAGAGALA